MLIANPKATSTSRRVRDLLVRAFSGDLDLELAETAHRGHATELARRAAEDKYDVVLALGGDGTVNEAINGLLAGGPAPTLPALAVLPIGSTNVFARALGLPGEPIGATRLVLDALRAGRHRWVGLGLADDRYFTFCAGVGLDAEVIREVEERRDAGARSNPLLYVRTALHRFFAGTDRRSPALTVERPGHPPIEGVFLSFVLNTAPWTYIAGHPVNPSPRAHFGAGLDLFGIRSLGVAPVLAAVAGMLLPNGRPVTGPHVVNVHDASEITLRADRPMAFQLDGDYLGERRQVTFRSVPRAIRIVI
ncbi:Diacylglycerol kinase family enzyme [Thermomonospora echinospora]|uniref:Diacylglycerol kinase family enzyme n=1 Tax=Thermomonospora echinospora TaxID=1992 RepID=A0A1H5V8D4_9ACTN|nr:diacylglycerol kinase family protein [Thermomonospora echinospora]SEF83021.1 Diacylglycerol kinase family enzyme [Thermomonospora echinospora]